MAYSQSYSPLPPPPIKPSGNRNTMHVVGGGTANMGYQSGANLANARTLYQQGRTGSFFQNKAEIKPEFNYKPQVTQGDAPPTAGQAAGNQIRANTGGQIRPANAPAGLGYAHYGMNPTRQHTLKGAGGIEGSGAHLSYVAPTLAAPPPPPPPPQVVSPQPPSVSPTPAGPKPGPNMAIDPKTGQELPPVGYNEAIKPNMAINPKTGEELAPVGYGSSNVFKDKKQADDAWDRNNMGARTMKNPKGGLMRTPKYAAFLRKHGFA